MATFPTDIPIGYDTSLSPDAGKRVENAEDGTIVIVNYFTNSVYQGRIIVPWATSSQLSTIESFYGDNSNVVWTFEHPGDGHSYNLYFTNAPLVERLETFGDQRFKVTLDVVGSRA